MIRRLLSWLRREPETVLPDSVRVLGAYRCEHCGWRGPSPYGHKLHPIDTPESGR